MDSNIDKALAFFDDYAEQVESAARNALDAAGSDAIDYARSSTGEMKPPPPGGREVAVKFTTRAGEEVEFVAWKGKNEGDRDTHPGGWADITGNLAAAYDHNVDTAGASLLELVLVNNMEYAAYLERQGYWILRGLFEGYMQQLVEAYFNEAMKR